MKWNLYEFNDSQATCESILIIISLDFFSASFGEGGVGCEKNLCPLIMQQ